MALLFAAPASVGGLRAPARSGAAIGSARPAAGAVCRPRRSTPRAAATEDSKAVPSGRPVVVAPVGGADTAAPPAAAAQRGVEAEPGALAEVFDMDQDAVAARARQLVADVQERPGWYASVAGYATGGFVVFVVASAVVGALDRLPILPSALQLVRWGAGPALDWARGKGDGWLAHRECAGCHFILRLSGVGQGWSGLWRVGRAAALRSYHVWPCIGRSGSESALGMGSRPCGMAC